jgi:endogenous inhibitor of DNA gyrase (YacG/DUF329 family)
MADFHSQAEKAASSTPAKCVICGKPQSTDYRPFCSKRCADIDLARWLNGVYAIPSVTEDDEEDSVPRLARGTDDPGNG